MRPARQSPELSLDTRGRMRISVCALRNVWSIQVCLHESVLERVDECGFVQAFYMHKYINKCFFFWRMFRQQGFKSHSMCVFVRCCGEGARGRAAAVCLFRQEGYREKKKRQTDRQTASKEVNRN